MRYVCSSVGGGQRFIRYIGERTLIHKNNVCKGGKKKKRSGNSLCWSPFLMVSTHCFKCYPAVRIKINIIYASFKLFYTSFVLISRARVTFKSCAEDLNHILIFYIAVIRSHFTRFQNSLLFLPVNIFNVQKKI